MSNVGLVLGHKEGQDTLIRLINYSALEVPKDILFIAIEIVILMVWWIKHVLSTEDIVNECV